MSPVTPKSKAGRPRLTDEERASRERERRKLRTQRERDNRAPASPSTPAAGNVPAPPPSFEQRDAEPEPGIDPEKMIRWALGGLHDALAVLTGDSRMKLSPLEESVAAKTTVQSLEMAGWTRFVPLLAPFVAVFVLIAIEGHRFLIIRQKMAEKAAQKAVENATEQWTDRFEEPLPEAQPRQSAPENTGIRAVAPEDLTFLEEVG
jgi:hypothetical protein